MNFNRNAYQNVINLLYFIQASLLKNLFYFYIHIFKKYFKNNRLCQENLLVINY